MKIVIADDHDLVMDALASLVERDDSQSVILKALDFPGALKLLQEHEEVDVALLDVYMPGMQNLESLRQLREAHPEVPVVLMSGLVQAGDVDKGFELGARGFIPKTMNGKALISVLRLVMSGAKYVPEIMLEKEQEPTAVRDLNLSPREMDVLLQLSKGFANKVIANNLGIEATTVKLHLRSLFSKLNVSNRTEAVIAAMSAGLLDIHPPPR